MSKSAKYISAILLLLFINLWLFLSDSGNDVKSAQNYFAGEDLAAVSGFKFVVASDTVLLSQTGNGWMVNNEYPADEGFINTLISVLERVEVRRSFESWNEELHGNVEVEIGFNSRYLFGFASNPNKTKSYFVTDEGAAEVTVPGYRDNVNDIFTLNADQWRDRMIFDGSWRTIQSLRVTNKEGQNFQIDFSDKFFLIDQKQPSDSSAIVDYLNQFQQFQANEMISEGRFSVLDSISLTEPFAELQIDDIKYEQPVGIRIFQSGANQSYHLAIDQSGQRMVIDVGRIRQILTSPDRIRR